MTSLGTISSISKILQEGSVNACDDFWNRRPSSSHKTILENGSEVGITEFDFDMRLIGIQDEKSGANIYLLSRINIYQIKVAFLTQFGNIVSRKFIFKSLVIRF